MSQNYQFFNHVDCEYYPCHQIKADELNCLFCFCPLYSMGKDCGGHFQYIGDVKDCSQCTLPHHKKNYLYIINKLKTGKEESL